GVLLRSHHLYLGHAGGGGNALGQKRLCVLVDGGKRQGRRGERKIEDRRVRGIDLAERRRCAHFLRQLVQGARNRRLHVLRGGVDVAIESELKRDTGVALRTQ